MNHKPHSKPLVFFERLQNLRSLACMVYDRAMASGLTNKELLSALEPVQTEYEKAQKHGVDTDLDGTAAAIELFEAQAQAQIKYATEIMEKAKDLQEAGQNLRQALADNMDAKGEQLRQGTYYKAVLVEGIGDDVRKRQLVIR